MVFNYSFDVKLEQESNFEGFVAVLLFNKASKIIGYLELVSGLEKTFHNPLGWGYKVLDLNRQPIITSSIKRPIPPFESDKRRALSAIVENFLLVT